MSYKEFDRVVLQTELDTHFGKIPAGKLCTIVSNTKENNENDMVILRVGFDLKTSKDILIGAAQSLLRKVTESELENGDYKDLVSRRFWVGEEYSVGKNISFDGIKTGDVVVIEDIKLATNEQKDLIKVSIDNKKFEFEREFIEVYFYHYNKAVEDMFGEEIDMKNKSRNYHVPGARVVLNTDVENSQKSEIVIITCYDKDSDKFIVENMDHQVLMVSKERLTPIYNVEEFITNYKVDNYVQSNYRVGNALVANENISNHALLNNKIKCGDTVEIVDSDNINIDIHEDVFRVIVNSNYEELISVSYFDLKNYFIPFTKHLAQNYKDDIDNSEFIDNYESISNDESANNDDDSFEESIKQLTNEKNNNGLVIKIHDISIADFRFKIDDNSFSINNNGEYFLNDIDKLILALQELKKINQK